MNRRNQVARRGRQKPEPRGAVGEASERQLIFLWGKKSSHHGTWEESERHRSKRERSAARRRRSDVEASEGVHR